MTARQQRFISEYTVDGNGAAAAIRAGYSKNRAKQEAYELLRTPAVKQAIAERFNWLTMSAEQATKHISDIARTRLNDYLVTDKVPKTAVVRKGLQALIDALTGEIELEEAFAKEATLEGKEATQHALRQRDRRNTLLYYQIELRHNPDAYRDVPETRLVSETTVDLVAIAQAKEEGLIKRLSFNEYGPNVEFYSAMDALKLILQIHGKLVQKLDHGSAGLAFIDFLKQTSVAEDIR